MKKLSRAFKTLAVTSILVCAAPSSHAASTLRIATLAPKESPWGKVFQAWSRAVDKKTNGTVDVTWLWNGVAGPERSVVGKIRTGQLAGGALTAVGLSSVYKPIVALQMPGAFKTWAELDKARAALRPEFDAHLTDAGFAVVGWGDVGQARTFSKGFEVRSPSDLRGRSPVMSIDDSIAPKVLEVIGGVTGHTADVNDILPLLQSGGVNVITAPAIAVEQLQWAAFLDHMNTGVAAFGIGATVLSQKALDGLSADEREVVLDTGRRASKILGQRIRKQDDASFERLKKRMTVHVPTAAERAAWEDVWRKACTRVNDALPGHVLEQIGYC